MAGELRNPIKATPEEMTKRMRKLKVIYDLPKIDLGDDKAVEDRIEYYFTYSIEQGLKPTIEGLALAIGISRNTLWEWETGKSRGLLGSSRGDMIKKAKEYISFLMSEFVMNGEINPITWIFYAKNYFGMKDVQEHTFTPTSALGEQIPLADLQKLADQHSSTYIVDVDSTDI